MVYAASLLSFASDDAFAQQANNEQVVTFVAEVPLLDCDGTPCIEARIGNGKPIRLVIDTGDVDTLLDTKVAEAAGIKPSGPTQSGMPAGTFPAKIAELQIGDLALRNVDTTAMTSPNGGRRARCHMPQGRWHTRHSRTASSNLTLRRTHYAFPISLPGQWIAERHVTSFL